MESLIVKCSKPCVFLKNIKVIFAVCLCRLCHNGLETQTNVFVPYLKATLAMVKLSQILQFKVCFQGKQEKEILKINLKTWAC